MAFLVQCNRCLETAPVEFANVDTGYWVSPSTWLTVMGGREHLCPSCRARAFKWADDVYDPRTHREDE